MDRDQAHKQLELLKRIAVAIEKGNTTKAVELSGDRNSELTAKGILDVVGKITDDYASKHPVDKLQGGERCDCDDDCPCNNELASDFHKDEYTYETDLQGIRKDDDHDIRSTAHSYEAAIDEDLHTKKDCILDYVTNEFGTLGARYTDIIKFAYYLGSPNTLKYTNANRGYYAMAFAPRYGGHLIQGGKDQLVKGINKEGDERYFALSYVDQATDYYKRIE